MTTPVQNPLTLLLPIVAPAVEMLREKWKTSPLAPAALDAVGTLHFARMFVFAEDNPAGIPPNTLAVITSYDGDFASYIQAFVNNATVAALIDEIMSVVDDPAAAHVVPVTKNAAAFAALVKKYDVTNPDNVPWGQWYSGYPSLTVQNILHPN